MSIATQSNRVLFVDDCVGQYKGFIGYMRKQGLEIETSVNVASAVEMLLRKPFDLVIIDIMMPVGELSDPSGFDHAIAREFAENQNEKNGGKLLISMIRKLRLPIRMLVFSNMEKSDLRIDFRSGSEDYLGKATEAETSEVELLNASRNLLDNHAWSTVCSNQMQEIQRLESGWDGYDAPKINSRVIQSCKLLLEQLMVDGLREPMIFPNATGGIQLEWHSNNQHLEIRLDETRTRLEAILYGSLIGIDPKHFDFRNNQVDRDRLKTMLHQYKEREEIE